MAKVRVYFEQPKWVVVDIPDEVYNSGNDDDIIDWLEDHVTQAAYVDDWEDL